MQITTAIKTCFYSDCQNLPVVKSQSSFDHWGSLGWCCEAHGWLFVGRVQLLKRQKQSFWMHDPVCPQEGFQEECVGPAIVMATWTQQSPAEASTAELSGHMAQSSKPALLPSAAACLTTSEWDAGPVRCYRLKQ